MDQYVLMRKLIHDGRPGFRGFMAFAIFALALWGFEVENNIGVLISLNL